MGVQNFQLGEKLCTGSQFTPTPAQVGIVILNWNGREVLQDCLRSICALRYPRFEVIVVDNGSKDGSIEMLAKDYPNVQRIENRVNLGFATGNNQGVRLALQNGNDYVLILNNDTLVNANCLASLVERAESDPQIAAVSPKIYFAQPADRVWFAGGTFSYWKGRNALIGYRQSDSPSWNTPREIDFVSGCALLVSRKAWQSVGGFDDLLFRSCEDVDWSLRARKAGYTLSYEPRAIIWHRESFDILRNEGQAGQMYFYTRNPLFLMWNQGSWWHWLTFFPYHIALSIKRALHAARRRDWKSIIRIAQGIRDFPALVRRRDTERTRTSQTIQ